jgi:hypothetical protein
METTRMGKSSFGDGFKKLSLSAVNIYAAYINGMNIS